VPAPSIIFLPVGVRTNRNARIRIPIAIPTVYLSLLIKQRPLMIERFGWWGHQPIGGFFYRLVSHQPECPHFLPGNFSPKTGILISLSL